MTARPILFSGPMVRALIEGRKTQTRRAVKPPRGFGPIENLKDTDPHLFSGMNTDPNSWGWPYADDGAPMVLNAWRNSLCPYGQPGDLVWVRETITTRAKAEDGLRFDEPQYRADFQDPYGLCFMTDDGPRYVEQLRWTPSIHMPRRYSRLTLRITDVRAQRLQDCSRGDAMSEGCPFANMQHGPDPRRWYADLWESINGPASWDANPWVWALTFEVIKANISEVSP